MPRREPGVVSRSYNFVPVKMSKTNDPNSILNDPSQMAADYFNSLANSVLNELSESSSWLATSRESADKKRQLQDCLKKVSMLVLKMSSAYSFIAGNNTAIEKIDNLQKFVESKFQNITSPHTYASTLTKPVNEIQIPGGSKIAPTSSHKIIIQPSRDHSEMYPTSDDTKAAIINRLPPTSLGLKITKVTKAKNSSIILESNSENLKSLIDHEFLDKVGLKCHTLGNMNPRIIIYDVPRNIPDKSAVDTIVSQNLSHIKDFKDEEIKFVTRLSDRKNEVPKWTNWIIEVSPRIRKVFLEDRIFLGWSRCRCADHFRILRCYNCQRVGHLSKDCKDKESVCGICAKNHKTENCDKKNLEPNACINCIRKRLDDNNHTANSNKCPLYIKVVKDLINRTNY